MKIIVCVDDNGGMLFNGRRQSRDKLMLEDMLDLVEKAGAILWIAPFSEKLCRPFVEMCPFITVEEDFLEKAGLQDYCFVENVESHSPKERIDQIDTVILYRWNRVYPADRYFDMDLSRWSMEEQKEFEGSSHEKITREVYLK